MRKRLTISLDEKLIWQLRQKQSDLMLERNQDISLSHVTYILLQNAIKSEKVSNSKLESTFVNPNGTYPMIEDDDGFLVEKKYQKNLENARR